MIPWTSNFIVIVPLLLLALWAALTRAPAKWVASAAVGGAVLGLGYLLTDLVALRQGWWTYPLAEGRAVGPFIWYVSAAVAFTGVGLVAWWLHGRYGRRGLVAAVVAIDLLAVAKGLLLPVLAPEVIAFGPGVTTWIVFAATWLALPALAIAAQFAAHAAMSPDDAESPREPEQPRHPLPR